MIIDPDCENKSYPFERLDQIITGEVLKLSFDPAYFEEVQAQGREVAAADDNAVIEDRLVEIDKQLNRLLDLYQLGSIDKDNLTLRVGDLNKEKAALLDQLVEPEDVGPSLTPDGARALLERAEAILAGDDLKEKRELVHALIDQIELIDDDIVIHWAFV